MTEVTYLDTRLEYLDKLARRRIQKIEQFMRGWWERGLGEE